MKVSICIPTYNQVQYLKLAINSAAQQTTPPLEIIVSNDYSTDGTEKLLRELSAAIPILKVINQPRNLGIVKNTNACLREASGDFIVRLDSDDMLSEKYVEKLYDLLIKYPEAGYAHAAVQEVDQNGNFLNQRRLFRKSVFISGNGALKAAVSGYRVAANIIMFRKEALLQARYLQCNIDFAEDYFLSAAIAAAGYGNVYSNEILSYYRVWSDAGMVRQKRKLEEIMGLRSVFENVLEPAFKQKGWNKIDIYKKRVDFASAQSNVLGWTIYTNEEKQQLKEELYKLAYLKPLHLQFVMWLYENGYGPIMDHFKGFVNLPKRLIKTLVGR